MMKFLRKAKMKISQFFFELGTVVTVVMLACLGVGGWVLFYNGDVTGLIGILIATVLSLQSPLLRNDLKDKLSRLLGVEAWKQK